MDDLNYYDDQQITFERVILAKKIKVDKYRATNGKFFFPILTPTMKQEDVTEVSTKAPNISKHKGTKLDVRKYKTVNYINLEIPRYIMMNFEVGESGKIEVPKGTQFLVTSLDKSVDYSKLRIIGLWSLSSDDLSKTDDTED